MVKICHLTALGRRWHEISPMDTIGYDEHMSEPQDISIASTIPSGYRRIQVGGPFMAHNGPLYARMQGDRFQLGFRVLPQHCNPVDTCHGGMIATFADMLLPSVALYQGMKERNFLPTISLQTDFLAGAPKGSWVHGEGDVLRMTRNMVFLQGVVYADDEPCARVSGIFKIGPVWGKSNNMDPYRVRSDPPAEVDSPITPTIPA